MEVKLIKSRMSLLLPTVPYANITLEAEVEIAPGTDSDEKTQEKANKMVREIIEAQRKEVDEYAKDFFKVAV